jgi:pilus assembly protein CpaB
VTVEVSTRDAQKLILAAGVGQLALALREAAADDLETHERITLTDLEGEDPTEIAAREAIEAARRKQRADQKQALINANKRANDQILGIQKAVEDVGNRLDKRIGQVESALNRPKIVKDDKNKVAITAPAVPIINELEVIRVIEKPKPKKSTVNVFRGLDKQSYEVPRDDDR